jgi:hypothetical protein
MAKTAARSTANVGGTVGIRKPAFELSLQRNRYRHHRIVIETRA